MRPGRVHLVQRRRWTAPRKFGGSTNGAAGVGRSFLTAGVSAVRRATQEALIGAEDFNRRLGSNPVIREQQVAPERLVSVREYERGRVRNGELSRDGKEKVVRLDEIRDVDRALVRSSQLAMRSWAVEASRDKKAHRCPVSSDKDCPPRARPGNRQRIVVEASGDGRVRGRQFGGIVRRGCGAGDGGDEKSCFRLGADSDKSLRRIRIRRRQSRKGVDEDRSG